MTSPVTSSPTPPPSSRKGKGAPYVCGLCAKEFKNGYNLRRHQATHASPAPPSAPPRPSPTLLPLPQDLLDAPQAAEDEEGAGGDSANMAAAAATKRTATAAATAARKSHACDTCGKAFRDVYHLKRHRLSHTDERPFQCPVCQQRFKRKDRMASHVRSHQGHVHKPYACGHCGKSFSRPDHLNSHVRQVHSTERPFKCQTCEAAFATRDRLRAHAVRHEDKVPCHVCGKLLSAAYVSDHLRVHGPAPRAQATPRGGAGGRGVSGGGVSGRRATTCACTAPPPERRPRPEVGQG
ncbi:LOW QUALITY PROTEIN: myc-associated zinc finger protein-like [Agelaius tricolor]|uniref:LOW QUALITY PROTEIN: myc-associated zinc finger protein-like n=1 Tax=Agelaius tricolor TaxID=9191 RepID=UPI0039F1CB57